jgi:hypothetical protein
MRFYTKKHKHYCGIDLHAKKCFTAFWMWKATCSCTAILTALRRRFSKQ